MKNPYSKRRQISFWSSVIIVACFCLNACVTDPTTGQKTLWHPTTAQDSAIQATDSQLQKQLPSNALPYLQAAEFIYAAYQGQTLPASSIKTGNSKVDSVLQKATTALPVAAQDVSTIKQLEQSFGG